MQVSEVTSSPTANPNFLAQDISMVEYQDPLAQLASNTSTKESSSSTADNNGIPCLTHILLMPYLKRSMTSGAIFSFCICKRV